MLTFTIIALVIIIIIKFLMYSSKPENQIEASDVRKKFKPFIETIMNSYMKSNIMCSVSDIDDDKRCVVIQTEKLTINDDKIFYTLYFIFLEHMSPILFIFICHYLYILIFV